MRADRGLSLSEVLIGAALVLLIGGLALSFLVTLYRSTTRATVRDGLHSKASVVMARMVDELRQTTVGALESTPNGLGFTRLDSITGTGQKVWEESSLFYFWHQSSSSLYKVTCPPTPPSLSLTFSPTRPPHLTPQILQAVFDPQSELALLLSDNATGFTVEVDGSLLILDLTLEQESVQERKERFTTSRRLKLRNS